MGRQRGAAIGVEIAGSGAGAALVDQHGRILHRCSVKTLRGRPAAATLEPYLRAVDAMYAYAHEHKLKCRGIGVSLPGTLTATKRRPDIVPLLPSLNGFPLCDLLEARYQLPTQLYVDVEAAALGEHHFGAGADAHRLFFLTVQAVVGASALIDNELQEPASLSLGHVSHLSLASTGLRCSCGKRGCISTLVSLHAMQKMIQRALRRGDESNLTRRLLNREPFSPRLLAEEAARGDSVALQVYQEMGRWLGMALGHYIDLFEPDTLILGGELMWTNDVLLARLRNALETSSAERGPGRIEIVQAQLRHDGMLIGAAAPFFAPSRRRVSNLRSAAAIDPATVETPRAP